MNPVLFLFALLVLTTACNTPTPTTSSIPVTHGRTESISNFNSAYVAARNVDIWLPPGYDDKQKYPVIYMHDGQMLFDANSTWNKQEWGVDDVVGVLIEEKSIPPCIVVGIWNGGKDRHIDYFPQKPFESLPQAFQDSLINEAKRNEETALFAGQVQSDAYLKFIVEELKPYIDQHYPTFTDAENTFIAGSSMGGLISMYALCEYPEVFSRAACLSTHWVGIFTTENNPIPAAFMNYLSKNLPSPENHKIYFDYGTATLDSLYEPFQLEADTILMAKGFTSENWVTKKYEGADHSEKAWNARLEVPIRFLLK